MKYSIYTLGCKVNSCDSDIISGVFEKAGLEMASEDETPDVVVVNTCAVTQESERKSRQLARRLKKQYPGAFVAVCGCFARTEGVNELSEETDLLTPSKNAYETGRLILEGAGIPVPEETAASSGMGVLHETKTRASLKIQDGCNRYCTYCIIPYLRSSLTSADPESVIADVRMLTEEGFREVVLTGIHIASYNYEGTKLIDVLERLENETGMERFRLGSLEPVLMSPEFTERLAKLGRICPQFHLSLQSGSAGVLKRMHRRYSPEEYLECLDRIRSLIPDAVFTTDIIVGFPGETQEEFEETLRFVEKARFAHVHIFPYSRRPGTPAASYPGQVSKAEKHTRLKILEEKCAAIGNEVLSGFVGKELSVLTEYINEEGLCEGYSENYLRCVFEGTENDIGVIRKVTVTGVRNGMLTAEA